MDYKKLPYLAFIITLIVAGCNSENEEKSEKNKQSESAPYLFTDQQGTVYLSWTESDNKSNTLKFATLVSDSTWSEPQAIASGENWFVNWADYPVIATKNGQSLIAHYLAKSGEGTYSYDVNVRQSNDGGKTWNEAYVLHEDGKQAEHGFVTILPYKDNFFVSWLDGRNTVSENDSSNNHHSGHGAMTLRAAVISPEGKKIEEWELDDRVCDCCQTSAAITDNGPVVVYRDRSEKEVRDISIVRWQGDSWTTPSSVTNDNWNIAGCPVNGPRISNIGNSLALGWFTAADNTPQVKLKFSHDGGITFGPVVTMSGEHPVGRVDVEMLSETTAMISWMEGADIKAAKVTDTGKVLETFDIATSSESRSSGFPQMAKRGKDIVFAWTDSESGRIKTKVLNTVLQ